MFTHSLTSQGGFSFFNALLILIAGYFIWSYIADGDYKDISAHAQDLKEKLQDFASQKGVAQTAYNDAMAAKTTAFQSGMKFKNTETQTFITKWDTAASEVAKMREKLDGIDHKAQIFFEQIDDELISIKEHTLRSKMENAVQDKAKSFAQSLKKAEEAIKVLETSLAKGQDVITAIKISGALGAVSNEIVELDGLTKTADSKFAEIDALVNEGMQVLNLELK